MPVLAHAHRQDRRRCVVVARLPPRLEGLVWRYWSRESHDSTGSSRLAVRSAGRACGRLAYSTMGAWYPVSTAAERASDSAANTSTAAVRTALPAAAAARRPAAISAAAEAISPSATMDIAAVQQICGSGQASKLPYRFSASRTGPSTVFFAPIEPSRSPGSSITAWLPVFCPWLREPAPRSEIPANSATPPRKKSLLESLRPLQ